MHKALHGIHTFVRLSPLWVCRLLGIGLGYILYAHAHKRRTAFINVKTCFPEKTNAAIRRIVRRSFINLGISLIECLIYPRISPYITIESPAMPKNRSGIMVGIHTGNWEMFNFAFARIAPYSIFVKKQKNPHVDAFLNTIRRARGLQICFSLKDVVTALKQNRFVGFMADHGAEENAPHISFFNQRVPTPSGAVRMAKKFNIPLYIGFDIRTRGFCHTIRIQGPFETSEKTEEELLLIINAAYEQFLREHPDNYLWYHKRFKHKKNREVIILSDGKTGHVKQSNALLSIMQESISITKNRTIEIHYKNNIWRNISEICAFFTTRYCLGCGDCLKYLLTEQTYAQLSSAYADIVISTGSYVSSVNKIFSGTLGAKSAIILRANIPLSRFNMSIIPEHDRIHSESIVKIRGALTYPCAASQKAQECRRHFAIPPGKKIAVFIGGSHSDSKEFMRNVAQFFDALCDFAHTHGYGILASSSRRTPISAEKLMEQKLAKNPVTHALVLARAQNYDFVFEGFASLADMVFVSSESISMICETLALKKPCVCLMLEHHVDKYKVFLKSIASDVAFAHPPYAIERITLKQSTIFEENRATITRALTKLL